MPGKEKHTLTVFLVFAVSITVFIVMAFASTGFRSALAGFTVPVLRAADEVKQGATAVIRTISPPYSSDGEGRVETYKKRIDHLKFRLESAENALRENQKLRRQLELPERPEWDITHAQVIARDPLSWNTRFRIDRGSKHSIRQGDGVLFNGEYVAGYIKSVSATTASVATVASPSCRLSVRVRGTEAFGVLRGHQAGEWYGPTYSIVEYLPPDITYNKGRVVETSGLSHQIPGGFPIGRIVEWPEGKISHTVRTVYKNVRAEPLADLQEIRFVAIVSKSRASEGESTQGNRQTKGE